MGVNKARRFETFQEAFVRYERTKEMVESNKWVEEADLATRVVTFQVTENCSLNCSYCYQGNKSKKRLSLDTAKKFIDLLFEESYNPKSDFYIGKVKSIILEFIGGEPLLEVKLIRQIINYYRFKAISECHIWATNYMISIISNGVHYFQDDVQELIKENQGKIDFAISLDGCKELHDSCRLFYDGSGSYDLVSKACIHFMENYNPNMNTKLTLAPENINWLSTAFKNLYNLGYDVIHANCVYEKGWNLNHAKILYSEMKKVADFILDNDLENIVFTSLFDEQHFKPMKPEDNHNYCGSTGYMIAVNPDGELFPCIRFMGSSLGDDIEPFSIGDVDNGIGKLECHSCRKCELNSVTRRSQTTDECYNCPVASGCGWCSAYNLQETGTVNKKVNYICDMHKARGLANVYYWNKVYKKNKEGGKFKMYLPKEDALRNINEDEYNMLLNLI